MGKEAHVFFCVTTKGSKIKTQCLIPARAFDHIAIMNVKILSICKVNDKQFLDCEKYNSEEKTYFANTVTLLRELLNPRFKHFRLSRVSEAFACIMFCFYQDET